MEASKHHVVLQIGSGTLHLMAARHGLADTVIVAGEAHADYAGYSEGQFFRPDQLGETLREMVENVRAQTREPIEYVNVGVPTDFCRVVTADASIAFARARKVRREDVDELFRMAEESLGEQDFVRINRAPVWFSADGDRRVRDPIGEKMTRIGVRASFVYAEPEFVRVMSEAMAVAGVRDVRYLSVALAELQYLLSPTERSKPVMLVDVGSGYTSVVVGQGDGITSLASFELGGGFFAAELSLAFHINFEEATRLKDKIVLSLDLGIDEQYSVVHNGKTRTYSALDANTVVSERLLTIGDLIARCLDLRASQIGRNADIWLTGGGILHVRGAKDLLSQKLGRNIRAAVPSQPLLDKPELAQVLSLVDLAFRLDRP